MWGGDMMGWGGGWGWGWFGIFHMFLWWILIILGIVVLARWLFGGGSRRDAPERRALEILAERYARGEIDREQFEKMKKDLST
jgi:putative membrane protein